MQTEKNKSISESRKQTQLKRSNQVCKVYTVKLHESSMNKVQMQYLEQTFREAKWWHNWALAMSKTDPANYDLFHFWNGWKDITHKDKTGQDISVSISLPSQIKQAITDQMASNIRTLSSLKKAGHQQPGQLKFKSEIKSINLKQYGYTHRFVGTRLKLVGCKKPFKINGLDQIPADAEFANAKLLKQPNGYYIVLTTYIDRNIIQPKHGNGQTIGIDFGCKTSFSLSNGQKINVIVKEPRRLKHLQRKLQKRVKASNNYCKTRQLLRIEYQKLVNRKNDLANKVCAEFAKYDIIIIQDEQLQNWHKIKYCSKTVQHSILGRVKSKLLQEDNVVVLSRWLPTTKLCTNCGTKLSLSLSDRQFVCSCGIYEDRDIHAAQNLVWFYKHSIGVGCTKSKPAEIQVAIEHAIKQNNSKVSLKQEDSTL